MSVIDDLEILITADARGLDNVLKRTIDTVTGTVDKINAQEVDWTSIFSRSVSPAIIAGVASMFAFAISNAVQFQQAMATTGTAAGDSTAQIGQLSNAALGLSTQVPSSAQDIATAMTQVSAVFSNVGDQQAVVAAMAELAASGFGDLSDIATAAIQVFKDFGVTTQQQAIQVLTSLMHGAESAKESIPALVDQFQPFDSALINAGVKVDNLNSIISTFAAEIRTVGASNASQIFNALAQSANNPVGPLELLGIGLEDVRKSLVNNGGLDAITKTSQIMERMGPSAQLVATAFGFSSQEVNAFQQNAKGLDKIAEAAMEIAQNTQSIGDAYKQSDNALRDLTLQWNTFKAGLIPIADILMKGMNEFVSADWLNTLTQKFDSATNQWSTDVTSKMQGVSNKVFDSMSNTFDKISDQIHGISENGPLEQGIVSNLQSSGVNFSTGQINQILKSAEQNNSVSQLAQLLTGGTLSRNNANYATLHNTFNLTVPDGSAILTGKQIAQQLYQQFQGY